MTNWAAEAQHLVHGVLTDVLAAPSPADAWSGIIERRFVPALVNPDVTHAALVEAVGVALIAVQCAAVWLDTPPLEVLDRIQGWRLPRADNDATGA